MKMAGFFPLFATWLKEGEFHENNERHFTAKFQYISPNHRGYTAVQKTKWRKSALAKTPVLHQYFSWKQITYFCWNLKKNTQQNNYCDEGTTYGKIQLKLLPWAGWKQLTTESWRQNALGNVHSLLRASKLTCLLLPAHCIPLPFSSKPSLGRSVSSQSPARTTSLSALQGRGDQAWCWPRDPTLLPDVTHPSICFRKS